MGKDDMLLPITLTMAGAAALINFWLALRCSRARMATGIPLGDGGNPRVIARMRAHANFVEYTPFVLILIGLIELAVGSHSWLWLAGMIYLFARILHAFGIERTGKSPLRMIGIAGTMVVMLGLAGYALYLPYSVKAPIVVAH
jgi:uncharacterized membrane protein YecN with MAPEG domain